MNEHVKDNINIIYKYNVSLSENEVFYLYNSLNWVNYTKDINSLYNGFDNSLLVISAWDNDKLIGLIRVVGDGFTIVYIQDILILKEYQGKNIGTNLMKLVLEKYKDVRQIFLTTDNVETNKNFYKKLGFVDVKDLNCVTFLHKK